MIVQSVDTFYVAEGLPIDTRDEPVSAQKKKNQCCHVKN